MTQSGRYRLGADVGGTHTDLVLPDTQSGELLLEKVGATPGRCGCAGNVPLAREETALRQAAREVRAAGVESIAVCHLFSFMNPLHERRTRALSGVEYPGVHVSLSSEVLPRIREWPRV